MARLNHTFSVEYAEAYGIECAILITHFQFWIEQNQAMGRNFHDGRTWMYQTQKEIAAIYPYWSEDVVFKTIKKLEDLGILIKGNYNKKPFDRTIWYAFQNEKMFTKPSNDGIETVKRRNRNRQTTEPIPDTNPDTNPDKQQQGARAPAAASSKKSKEQGAPKIHQCLESIDISNKEKAWITKTYDEETVTEAIAWATSPQTKITTTLTQAIKWACVERPEMPLDPKTEIEKNKKIAKHYDEKRNAYAQIHALNKHIEITPLSGQSQSLIILYTERDFETKFKEARRKYRFTE